MDRPKCWLLSGEVRLQRGISENEAVRGVEVEVEVEGSGAFNIVLYGEALLSGPTLCPF